MKSASHTVVHSTDIYPTGLKTAEEISSDLKFAVSAARISALAETGYAPCFRIDGGPPMFKSAEIKEWIARNLVTKSAGRPVPDFVRVTYDGDQIEDPYTVPKTIRDVTGSRDITKLAAVGSGIYFLCNGGEVVYVGQSVFVSGRIGDHMRENVKEFDSIYYFPWPADKLNEAEGAFIRALNPKQNGRRNTGTTVAPVSENGAEFLVRVGFGIAPSANDNELAETRHGGDSVQIKTQLKQSHF